jgi:hypothetical protein
MVGLRMRCGLCGTTHTGKEKSGEQEGFHIQRVKKQPKNAIIKNRGLSNLA